MLEITFKISRQMLLKSPCFTMCLLTNNYLSKFWGLTHLQRIDFHLVNGITAYDVHVYQYLYQLVFKMHYTTLHYTKFNNKSWFKIGCFDILWTTGVISLIYEKKHLHHTFFFSRQSVLCLSLQTVFLHPLNWVRFPQPEQSALQTGLF